MSARRFADRRLAVAASILVVVALPIACTDAHINTATTGTAAGGSSATGHTGGASASDGATTGSLATSGTGVVAPPDHVSACQGHVYECGDLVDNDGDGLVDSQDPDCVGPCDNSEASLFGGIPGEPGPACKVDCYFDQDSGPGNDDCHWDHTCDPYEVAPNYYPEPDNGSQCAYGGADQVIPPTGLTCTELNASQSQTCHDVCGPLTPNGCDCFGCCELPAKTGHYVWLGSEGQNSPCTLDKLTDDTACHPCVPVADCFNGCGPCEICIGKPAPDPGCTASSSTSSSSGTGGGTQCLPGVQECGLPGLPACPTGYFCLTGCCTHEPQ